MYPPGRPSRINELLSLMNNEVIFRFHICCILFLTFPAMLLANRSCTQDTKGFQRISNERQTRNVDLNQNRMSDGNI